MKYAGLLAIAGFCLAPAAVLAAGDLASEPWLMHTFPLSAWNAVWAPAADADGFLSDLSVRGAVGQPKGIAARHARRIKLVACADGSVQATLDASELASGAGTLFLIGHIYNPVMYRHQAFKFRLACDPSAICSVNGKPLAGNWTDGVFWASRGGWEMNAGTNRVVIAIPASKARNVKLEIAEPGDCHYFADLPSNLDPSRHVEDYRAAHISNGLIDADVAVPDSVRGYYRADRFEQAGMILKLRCDGHAFFPDAPSKHDPLDSDRPIGPSEEFFNAIAWSDAKPGEQFIKIGVGLYERPYDTEHKWYQRYWLIRLIPWRTTVHGNSIEFVQELRGPRNWGYRYVKRIVLVPGKREMRIEHEFINTGGQAIDAEQYNHNWAAIDGTAVSGGYRVDFAPPIAVKLVKQQDGVSLDGNSLLLTPSKGGQVSLAGNWLPSPDANAATISSSQSLATMKISGDFTLSDARLYFQTDIIAFEPFYRFRVAPGERTEWTRIYDFGAKSECAVRASGSVTTNSEH